MPRNTPYAGVAAMFRSALERGEAPRVFEDGCQRRDFVHVSDVAAAFATCLAATAELHSATALQRRLRRCQHGRRHGAGAVRARRRSDPVVTGDYRLGDVRHITASSELLRRELGWRASRFHLARGSRGLQLA